MGKTFNICCVYLIKVWNERLSVQTNATSHRVKQCRGGAPHDMMRRCGDVSHWFHRAKIWIAGFFAPISIRHQSLIVMQDWHCWNGDHQANCLIILEAPRTIRDCKAVGMMIYINYNQPETYNIFAILITQIDQNNFQQLLLITCTTFLINSYVTSGNIEEKLKV